MATVKFYLVLTEPQWKIKFKLGVTRLVWHWQLSWSSISSASWVRRRLARWTVSSGGCSRWEESCFGSSFIL